MNWPTISAAPRLRTSVCVPVWQNRQDSVQPTWQEMQTAPRSSSGLGYRRSRPPARRGSGTGISASQSALSLRRRRSPGGRSTKCSASLRLQRPGDAWSCGRNRSRPGDRSSARAAWRGTAPRRWRRGRRPARRATGRPGRAARRAAAAAGGSNSADLARMRARSASREIGCWIGRCGGSAHTARRTRDRPDRAGVRRRIACA